MILAVWRELHGLIVAGLGIFENFSFVIAYHDLFVVVIENITGIDRHFPAAAGGVDDELRDSVTDGVAEQTFDLDRRVQFRGVG